MYRDIAELEANGTVSRERGIVSAAASTLTEASAQLRVQSQLDSKRRIAEAALDLVTPGMSLLLDDSTTNLHLFPHLAKKSPLTVITNARFIEEHVIRSGHLQLLSCGGDYYSWADAYFGPVTDATVAALNPDWVMMSTSAVSGGECFHPNSTVARTKRAMIESGRNLALLVDHTKFTRTALHKFAILDDFDVIIADSKTSINAVTDYLHDQTKLMLV